jgi:hypothetical protein
VTVTFKKQGGATRMTLTHAGFPDRDAARAHQEAWTGMLERACARGQPFQELRFVSTFRP